MCRYAVHLYKPHYACFKCRKTFKRKLLSDIQGGFNKNALNFLSKCPECGSTMANMGMDFKSPKKRDIKAWEHIENLFQTGITFHSCGCNGPGYIPKDKDKLLEYLIEKKEIFLKHQRFWIKRIEPETEADKQRDVQKNSMFLWNLPKNFSGDNRNNSKAEIKKAVVYWSERIKDIENKIKLIKTAR